MYDDHRYDDENDDDDDDDDDDDADVWEMNRVKWDRMTIWKKESMIMLKKFHAIPSLFLNFDHPISSFPRFGGK